MTRPTGACLSVLAVALACGQADVGGPQHWPHEPPGFSVVTDQSWGAVGSLGWGHLDRRARGYDLVDMTLPFRPPKTLAHEYPVGFEGGYEPAVDWYRLPDARAMFVGFWWRASNPWQGHPVVNKLTFITQEDPPSSGASSNAILAFGDSPFKPATNAVTGPWVVRVALEFAASNGHLPNSTGDDPGSRNLFGNSNALIRQGGAWHAIELLLLRSTTATSRDGIVQWWVDGQLVGDYTTVNFDQRPFVEFQFAPTWGGMGGIKTQRDFIHFGPVHISQP